MRQFLLLFILFLFFRTALFAQVGGTLDNTFAGNGKKQTNEGGGAAAVAINPVGQNIVVAGNINSIAEYTPTGTMVTTFGSNGIVTLNLGVSIGFNAAAVQPDGKIIVAGAYYVNGGNPVLFLGRLTATGALDPSFNGIGFITIPGFGSVATGQKEGANAVAIQPDGKIVVAGMYLDPVNENNKYGPFDFGVARITSTGQLDNSFGTGGVVYTNSGNSHMNLPTGVAVTSGGKIVVCGYRHPWIHDVTTGPDSVLVMQYTSTGVLDVANFGTNGTGGIARFSVGSNRACTANAIALQTDGRILLGGSYLPGSNHDFLAMRLNTNGTLDNTFAGNGKLGVDFGSDTYGTGIGIEPGTGAIVMAGLSLRTGGNQFAICRIVAADGTLDNTFGAGGQEIIPWTTANPMFQVANVAIQANARIVVTGTAAPPSDLSNGHMATIRLLSSASTLKVMSDSATLTRSANAFSTEDRPGIKLFPNPAATQLQVTGLPVNEPVTLTVTDMGGNTLLQQRTRGGNVLLDISRLTSAAYVLSIAGTTTRQSLPFIKGSR